jgi:hypothetical protein
MTLVKYMGSSDARHIGAGENFGGRLAAPLQKDVVWDWANNHVVDSQQVALSDEAVALLLEEGEFSNVTGLERVPLNRAQQLWRGMSDASRAPGDLPPGFTSLGAIPTSADNASGTGDASAPTQEAAAFAASVNDTPDDPVVQLAEDGNSQHASE